MRILLLLLLSSYAIRGYGQETKRPEYDRIYGFANKILAENGQFKPFNLKDESLSSTHTHFFLHYLAHKRFGKDTIYIYETGVISSRTPRYLIIARMGVPKTDGALIPLLVIGRTHAIRELEKLYLFFSQYTFPAAITSKCYEILIGDTYKAETRNGSKIIVIDSLFPNSN